MFCRGWLQSALSRTEGGSRDTIGDATGSTVQPIWSSSNPQVTGQKSAGPDLMLSRSFPAPDMAPSSSHWLKILDCCRELEEGRQYWYTQRKESTWRLNRLEAKLESEKMQRWKQKMEEVEASILSLRAEECRFLEELEADYKEKVGGMFHEPRTSINCSLNHYRTWITLLFILRLENFLIPTFSRWQTLLDAGCSHLCVSASRRIAHRCSSQGPRIN